ncbi:MULTISPECIES: phospholipase D family protein [Pseudomonas]|uniref:phospholipase D family nuclease n=1 Tax=Pseudomonas TaxID=286 RepID=UPI00089DD521|nr:MULTISPECIES: phospholipase D family protein [Pseudomonas]MEC4242389.1 phospholipase D family protein [Pseudomonas sp. DSV-1]
MVSRVFKPLALTMALVAGVSQQVLALAADNEGDGSRRIDVGFSPEGSAQKLVLRTIDAATSSIRVAAYVFTSPDVTRALVAAKQRGVDVAVVADHRSNLEEARSTAGRHALTLLAKAGIPTRTVKSYPIHHDKFMVVDGMAVETGSFNFTAAAKSNSENALVVWNDPALAETYLNHWQSRWDQGQAFKVKY